MSKHQLTLRDHTPKDSYINQAETTITGENTFVIRKRRAEGIISRGGLKPDEVYVIRALVDNTESDINSIFNK